MSCEYSLRCKNNDKCYRCFDHQLLKLPEDKNKAKNKKVNRVFDNKVAESDDSWKDLEQQVSEELNFVPTMKEARRSRASGALWFEKGDVIDDILMPECKERLGRQIKEGNDQSISILKSWLEKADKEAQEKGKIMINPFRFKKDIEIYANMKFKDIAELVTMMKAYMLDNDAKAKEIALLKAKLKEQGDHGSD